MTDPTLIADFLAALAILAMLAVAFGAMRGTLPSPALAEPVLGLFFGAVAVLEMQQSFPFAPGLIVDMRNVPLALAGAFLGLRGFLTCLAIAAAARLSMGGAGAPVGVVAMLLAGGAGAVWHALTLRQRRGPVAFAALGAAMSLHLSAALLLPSDQAVWFLTNAGPVLFALNMISVPLIAALLERERHRMIAERTLRQAASLDGGQTILPASALDWALAHAAATGTMGGPVTALSLRRRTCGALALLWSPDVDRIMEAELRTRLQGVMPERGLMGQMTDTRILVVLPRMEPAALDALLADIRRAVCAEAVRVAGMASARLMLDSEMRHHAQLPPLARMVGDFTRAKVNARPRPPVAPTGPGRCAGRGRIEPSPGMRDLFDTFDRLNLARQAAR